MQIALELQQAKTHEGSQSEMGLSQSLLYFGIPTLIMFASFHWLLPALQGLGWSDYEAFIAATTAPMALLLLGALYGLHHEQPISSWGSFRRALQERMRFPQLTWKAVLQGLGLYLVMVVLGGAFGLLSRALINAGLIPLPNQIPLLLDPLASLSAASLSEFVGGQLIGRWSVLLLFVIQLFFNIAGEELWWRGFILPQQEAAYGRWAWVVHGMFWWGFHAFKWWDMIAVLPLTLILSYAAQRTKNNWVPTIAHLLANSLLLAFLALGVAGQL